MSSFFLTVEVHSDPSGKISFVDPHVLPANQTTGPAETQQDPGEAADRIMAKIFTPGPQATEVKPSYSFMDVHSYVRKAVLKASGFNTWKEFPKKSILKYSSIFCREALLKKTSGKKNHRSNWKKYQAQEDETNGGRGELMDMLCKHGFKLDLIALPKKKFKKFSKKRKN